MNFNNWHNWNTNWLSVLSLCIKSRIYKHKNKITLSKNSNATLVKKNQVFGKITIFQKPSVTIASVHLFACLLS